MKVSIKKLLLIVGIIFIGFLFPNDSKAMTFENKNMSFDAKDLVVYNDFNDNGEFYNENYEYLNVRDINSTFYASIQSPQEFSDGKEGFTNEDINDLINSINYLGNDTELVEANVIKIGGASARRIIYKNNDYDLYTDEIEIMTDNYRIWMHCYSHYLYPFRSQTYNNFISSIKIKDTISIQNNGVPFSDVSNKQWYHEPIKYVYEKGYISGLNAYTYGPNVNLSRCMLVTILWRISGNPAAKGNVSFPDIRESDWYYTPVVWAAENGIVNGYGNGNFGPNDNISREQLATMLRNYSIYRGVDSSFSIEALNSFKDNKKVADWATPGVAWAIKNQIIGGKDNGTIIDPQGNATRAEVATMIMQLDKNLLKRGTLELYEGNLEYDIETADGEQELKFRIVPSFAEKDIELSTSGDSINISASYHENDKYIVKFIPIKEGTSYIYVTEKNKPTTITIKVNVTLTIVNVTGIELDKDDITIIRDKTQQLTATVKPDDATNKKVIWSSSDETIATVDSKGVVTGKKKGDAIIYATTEDGNYSATCNVEVKNPPLTANCNIGLVTRISSTAYEKGVQVTVEPNGGSGTYTYNVKLYYNGNLIGQGTDKELFVLGQSSGQYQAVAIVTDGDGTQITTSTSLTVSIGN